MSKAIGHVVVLDPRTIAGEMYLRGRNDGVQTVGELQCPVLICDRIETQEHGGINVHRTGLKEAPISQSLFLPYGTVALIFDALPDQTPSFGFAPRA